MSIMVITDEHTSKEGRMLAEKLYDKMSVLGWRADQIFMDDSDNYESCLPFFLESSVKAVVTFDMAGFHTVSAEGETFYNSMYCDCIHILTKEPWNYPDELLKRMLFTTVIVVATEREKEYVETYYENVIQVKVIKELESLREKELNSEKVDLRIKKMPRGFREAGEEIRKNWNEKSFLPDEIELYLREHNIKASEGEFIELCSLFRDIPLYMRSENKKDIEEEELRRESERVIQGILSLLQREERTLNL